MRKTLLILLCLISAKTFAQIPNNGFETWATPTGQTYENPTGWGSSNDVGSQLPAPFVNATKETTDPGAGTSSLKLETVSIFVTNVAGVALTGEITYTTTLKFSGGFPFTARPGQLTGKMKYTPAAGTDSSFIYAVLFKWNSALNKRDTIATSALISPSANNWTTFGSSLNYTSSDNPDSALILISSSKGFLGSAGSKLWIDDLSFQYESSVGAMSNAPVHVFPNPAQHTLYLNAIPGQFSDVIIYDCQGRLVMQAMVQGNAVDISSLANGTYIISTTKQQSNPLRSLFTVSQ